jgi:hypothetical protein
VTLITREKRFRADDGPYSIGSRTLPGMVRQAGPVDSVLKHGSL